MSDTAIERRQGDALSEVVGTGDVRASLASIEQNVRDIIDVGRDRGFVTNTDGRDFFHFPLWHLLGTVYDVTARIDEDRLVEVDGGYRVLAIAESKTGKRWTAWATCTKKEPRHEHMTDQALLAKAQTRAMRNALRSAFASALVLAGFDFADPNAPATKEQVGLLHQLERALGWTHAEGHDVAEVQSYTHLTREQASELIENWTALRDDIQDVKERGAGDRSSAARSHVPSAGPAGEQEPDAGEPPGKPEPLRGRAGTVTQEAPAPCSHPSWKRSEGVLRCTKCGVPKSQV